MLDQENIINDSSIPKPEIVELSDLYITKNGIEENSVITNNHFPSDFSLSALRDFFFSLDDNKTAKEDFMNEILFTINNMEFEFGVKSTIETIFNKYHEKFGVLCVEWLSKLFIRNIYDSKVVLGIMLLLSRLNPNDFGALGETMIFNALFVVDSLEVKEAAIRVIEKWDLIDMLETLATIHFEEEWLEEYKLSVIQDISE